MSESPHARKERARRRRQRSPRGCSSPSFILVAADTSLPSFSCTAQVATLAPSTWKSQTIVYDCIKETRTKRQAIPLDISYYHRSWWPVSFIAVYLICTSTQHPQQRGPALAFLLIRTGRFGLVSSQLELSKFCITVSPCGSSPLLPSWQPFLVLLMQMVPAACQRRLQRSLRFAPFSMPVAAMQMMAPEVTSFASRCMSRGCSRPKGLLSLTQSSSSMAKPRLEL